MTFFEACDRAFGSRRAGVNAANRDLRKGRCLDPRRHRLVSVVDHHLGKVFEFVHRCQSSPLTGLPSSERPPNSSQFISVVGRSTNDQDPTVGGSPLASPLGRLHLMGRLWLKSPVQTEGLHPGSRTIPPTSFAETSRENISSCSRTRSVRSMPSARPFGVSRSSANIVMQTSPATEPGPAPSPEFLSAGAASRRFTANSP